MDVSFVDFLFNWKDLNPVTKTKTLRVQPALQADGHLLISCTFFAHCKEHNQQNDAQLHRHIKSKNNM